MANLISGFRRPLSGIYNLWRLVDSRFFERELTRPGLQHIICDIDKTYLETDFDTLLKIAKIAFEDAHDKITVQGASEVLLAARWGLMNVPLTGDQPFPRPLHFVSSSPPQLRSVLEEKFALDGLDWSSDTFKNQAYNIRKGRFDLLKQQIAYKTAAILNLMHQQLADARYYMIGDNAEADLPIYLGIKLFVEQRISTPRYSEYLQLLGVEPEVARALLGRFTQPPKGRVEAILIRKVKDLGSFPRLTISKSIVLFDNFLEVAFIFALRGLIDAESLGELLRTLHNRYGISRGKIAAFLRAARRRANPALTAEAIGTLLERWDTGDSAEKEVEIVLPEDGGLSGLQEDDIMQYCTRWIESSRIIS